MVALTITWLYVTVEVFYKDVVAITWRTVIDTNFVDRFEKSKTKLKIVNVVIHIIVALLVGVYVLMTYHSIRFLHHLKYM